MNVQIGKLNNINVIYVDGHGDVVIIVRYINNVKQKNQKMIEKNYKNYQPMEINLI